MIVIFKARLSLLMLAMLFTIGCQKHKEHHNQISLDMDPNYKVTKADWIDNERHRVGWPMGFRFLRGKTIHERNGIFPIHIMRSEIPELKVNPFAVDDLLLAVNNKPLGKDGVDEVGNVVKRGIKLGLKFTITFWRKGVIDTVEIDGKYFQVTNKIPDLTKGGKPDETRDWTLGPIGVNGWGWSLNATKGASAYTRQLLITLVDKDGPAFGKLKKGDVIIGTDNQKFEMDARKVLAKTINEAEKKKNKGNLNLLVWRDGEERNINITIPVLGSYSETAPFDCAKTERIIDNGVAYMLKNKDNLLKPGGWINYVNGLGLLATGRDDLMPIIKEMAHGSILKEDQVLSVEEHVSMQCWWWSYKTIFLCEYYLKTKDKKVLPTIEAYANIIALGQSGAGTWGHTYAAKANTGYYHGHLGGYGAINQMGLTLMIALPLAKKCGINSKEVNDAIKRGDEFFRFFIGKGTIPYGDHGAAPWYDDNGKSGSAAIVFDLLNNKQGTKFFSEMILASAPGGRENGHTGHYWSHLWGGIGIARAGDKGLQAYMNEMNHIFTLERQYNGRFAFQNNVGEKGDKGKEKKRWDCTGARLLQLCVPKRELFITGKNTPRKTHLTEKRISDILKAGRLKIDRKARGKLSQAEIIELLKAPLSPTRATGVRILEEREINIVEILIEMLDDDNKFARYGAASALGRVGFANKKAADKLIKMMEADDDTQFKVHAIAALTNTDMRMGLAAVSRHAIPALLRMAVKPAKDDPRKVLQNDIARALFYNGRAEPKRGLIPLFGLDGVDRKLLIPAIKELLTNKMAGLVVL